jgi:U3 small nucleolar RNA-associated protein 13
LAKLGDEKEKNQKEVKAWRGHDLPVLDMAYSPSGLLLATSSADRTVRVWNVEKGYCTHNFKGHKTSIPRVIFHPMASRMEVISCADDGQVRVWQLETGVCHELDNHMGTVTGASFSNDGMTMITVGRDKVVNSWNLRHYSHNKTIPLYEALEGVVTLPRACVLPSTAKPKKLDDGSREDEWFAVGGEQGSLRLFGMKSMKPLITFDLPRINSTELDATKPASVATAISHVLIAPKSGQSGRLVAVTHEHNFYVYDVATHTRNKLIVGTSDLHLGSIVL